MQTMLVLQRSQPAPSAWHEVCAAALFATVAVVGT